MEELQVLFAFSYFQASSYNCKGRHRFLVALINFDIYQVSSWEMRINVKPPDPGP